MKRALIPLLAAALLGCGSPSGKTDPSDVMFLQMMIPHHGQGVSMVALAKTRSSSADVKMLAAAIESTQASEITTMEGWLRSWGKPANAAPDSHAGHGGLPATSAAEITTLQGLDGQAFDQRLLNLMIAHQDDAIQLARWERTSGSDGEVKDLADRIERSRTSQIELMKNFLTQLHAR